MSRPRNPNAIRDAAGRARGEPPHLVRAVALAQRRREVAPEHADNPLAGHALGRLRLRHQPHGPQDPCSISQEQYEAGERYAKIASRHARIMGYASGSPQSARLEVAPGGVDCAEEPDAETIVRVRRGFADCYRVLMDAGRTIGQGTQVALVTYDVCLDRRRMEGLTAVDVGNLKVGLNALARLFKGRARE
jgi:hypothetical protein